MSDGKPETTTEYRAVEFGGMPALKIVSELNRLAAEGWKLVSMDSNAEWHCSAKRTAWLVREIANG